MKSIMFIAPPAAGKGTQSEIFSKKYNLPTIASLNTIMVDGTGMCGERLYYRWISKKPRAS